MAPERWRQLAPLIPTILLLATAATQMALARTSALSPWKGGGFGMFASIDGSPFRWARIYVLASERSEELVIPPSLEDQAHRAITWPRRDALEAFARAVLSREQRHERPVESVRIEIWKADVSPSLDVSETLLRQVTVSVDDVTHARGR